MYRGRGDARGEVYAELKGEGDFDGGGDFEDDEDDFLLELLLLEGFGRTWTSRGSFEDLTGIRVMVGPAARGRVRVCPFLSLLDLEEEVLVLTRQSVCFLLPQLAHDGGPICWSCSCDWLMR
jgi:hypothetical protein